MNNLKFAKFVEPNNPIIDAKIKQCEEIREMGEFTVGSKLIEERLGCTTHSSGALLSNISKI